MKVNGEIFLEQFNQYKIKEKAILVSGNESGLIAKIENLIVKKFSSNIVNKGEFFDFKSNKNINFTDLMNSKSLFGDYNIIQIINPDLHPPLQSREEELRQRRTKNNRCTHRRF